MDFKQTPERKQRLREEVNMQIEKLYGSNIETGTAIQKIKNYVSIFLEKYKIVFNTEYPITKDGSNKSIEANNKKDACELLLYSEEFQDFVSGSKVKSIKNCTPSDQKSINFINKEFNSNEGDISTVVLDYMAIFAGYLGWSHFFLKFEGKEEGKEIKFLKNKIISALVEGGFEIYKEDDNETLEAKINESIEVTKKGTEKVYKVLENQEGMFQILKNIERNQIGASPILKSNQIVSKLPEDNKVDYKKSLIHIKKRYNEDHIKILNHYQKIIKNKEETFSLFKETFSLIIKAKKLTPSLKEQIKFILESKKINKIYKIALVSAISISMIENFTDDKGEILINLIHENEDIIWEKALIGLILAFNFNLKKIERKKTNKIYKNFEELIGLRRVENGIFSIVNLLFNYNFNWKLHLGETSKRNDNIYLWFLPKQIEKDKKAYVSVIPESNIHLNVLGNYKVGITDKKEKGIELIKNHYLRIYLGKTTTSKTSNTDSNLNFYLKEILIALVSIPSIKAIKTKPIKKTTHRIDYKFYFHLTIIKNLSKLLNRPGIEGVLEFKSGRYDLALKLLIEDRYLNQDPIMLFYLGKIYIQREQYKEAIYYLKKAVNIDSNFIEIYLELSFAYLKIRRYKLGLKYAQKKLHESLKVNQITKQTKKTYLLFIEFYLKLSYPQKALYYLLKANDYFPKDYIILAYLGDLYFKYGKFKKGIFYYKKAIKTSNKKEKIKILEKLHGFYLYFKNDHKIAYEYLKKIRKMNPNSPKLNSIYIFHYTYLEQYSLVDLYLERLISKEGSIKEIYRNINHITTNKSKFSRNLLSKKQKSFFFNNNLYGKILSKSIDTFLIMISIVKYYEYYKNLSYKIIYSKRV
ncbi:tetratricopeptide repeat protein [Tenacibaculum sp. M341]|uniref:tetratricopeptide repeat protein n=1 Tax=Tenacibaculum sp. M341 TaxID=2530339 RepID=UPI001404B801|nr:tetratricopeptide repeat protein [Tenacibaculum sp. M341]